MLDSFNRLRGGTPWNKVAYVYIIRNETAGLYKIGYTNNVDRRLKELQKCSVDDLDIWVAWQCPESAAKSFESIAHLKYHWARTHGEWYRLDYETARDVRYTRSWAIPAFRVKPTAAELPLQANPYHIHML